MLIFLRYILMPFQTAEVVHVPFYCNESHIPLGRRSREGEEEEGNSCHFCERVSQKIFLSSSSLPLKNSSKFPHHRKSTAAYPITSLLVYKTLSNHHYRSKPLHRPFPARSIFHIFIDSSSSAPPRNLSQDMDWVQTW